MSKIYLLIMIAPLLLSCNKGTGSGKTGDPSDSSLVRNAGFESDNASTLRPAGWSTDFDAAASVEKGGHQSGFSLIHRHASDYKVYTYQKISNLPNGIYKLTAWVQNSGGQNACYVNAKDYGNGAERMTSVPVTQGDWKQVIIRGIEVANGHVTIGLFSDAKGGDWCKVDDWKLEKDGIAYHFLKGGDVSELSYLESKGAKFFDKGVQKDCFQILKDNGFNIVRLRLYNDPGNAAYVPSNRLPSGFQDAADILSLARRAKAAGMQIQLTFHYSDYWTNGDQQIKPHDWATLSYPELKQAVYDFTFEFMNQMKAQNTLPEYVSLGNETPGGMLYPDGNTDHFHQMAELFNQGYDAIKAVSAETKVIIHLDDAGNTEKYRWFFSSFESAGGKYDLIGASYYPFWTQKTAEQVRRWANTISTALGKKIMIMETGYNWNPTLPEGGAGQLSNNGPYQSVYPGSPAGQRDFLYEVFNELKLADNGAVIGDLYWDPVMIAVPGVGWELGKPNVVANTTLFDFEGNVLPAFKVFKYNN